MTSPRGAATQPSVNAARVGEGRKTKDAARPKPARAPWSKGIAAADDGIPGYSAQARATDPAPHADGQIFGKLLIEPAGTDSVHSELPGVGAGETAEPAEKSRVAPRVSALAGPA